MFTSTAFESHMVHNKYTAYQLLWCYQSQWVPLTAWTVFFTWYTRRKLARIKILNIFGYIRVCVCVYIYKLVISTANVLFMLMFLGMIWTHINYVIITPEKMYCNKKAWQSSPSFTSYTQLASNLLVLKVENWNITKGEQTFIAVNIRFRCNHVLWLGILNLEIIFKN